MGDGDETLELCSLEFSCLFEIILLGIWFLDTLCDVKAFLLRKLHIILAQCDIYSC